MQAVAAVVYAHAAQLKTPRVPSDCFAALKHRDIEIAAPRETKSETETGGACAEDRHGSGAQALLQFARTSRSERRMAI